MSVNAFRIHVSYGTEGSMTVIWQLKSKCASLGFKLLKFQLHRIVNNLAKEIVKVKG